jgi:uncharacterized protein (DUF924 family)
MAVSMIPCADNLLMTFAMTSQQNTNVNDTHPHTLKDVLDFWFEQSTPKQWFNKSRSFDEAIALRFAGLVHTALAGQLRGEPDGSQDCLALILVLDQFPRHIFRGTPKAFDGDKQALRLSQFAVASGWLDQTVQPSHRQFLLMPMMHSEDVKVQHASLPLFERYTDANTSRFAKRHCEIIERFGRFPHRNSVLGRVSSADEIEFLKQPGSSF